MKLEELIDNLSTKVTSNRWLQIFTAFTRVLLAVGFIPPSLKKILNQPFTILPDSHPVGHYFNALYQTGFYYQFIGWAQLIAAILLLFPRTAHLGALLFLPIIANIAVLTSSVGFVGTNYITASMLLATIYLVCWDYERIKPIFFSQGKIKSDFPKLEFLWLPALFTAGGAALAIFFVTFGIGNLHKHSISVIIFLALGGLVFGLLCTFHHKFMTIKRFEGKNEAKILENCS